MLNTNFCWSFATKLQEKLTLLNTEKISKLIIFHTECTQGSEIGEAQPTLIQ